MRKGTKNILIGVGGAFVILFLMGWSYERGGRNMERIKDGLI